MSWPGQKVGAMPAPQQSQQQPAPQSGSTLRPVLSLPDPNKERDQQRDDVRLQLAVRADERAAQTQAMTQSLTPAQKAVDNKFATSYVEWAVDGGRSDYQKSRTQLDEVLTALDRGDDLTGPITGRVPDAIRSFTNPESIAARDAVEEVVQRNLRLVLGGQFAEKEGERLIARAYNQSLPEAENAKRVRRLLGQIDQGAAAKDAAAQYYEENGTLAGWTGKIPSIGDIEAGFDGGGEDGDIRITDFGGVTEEQSAEIFGVARFDAQGNPVGAGYTGETFLADGTPGPFMGAAEGDLVPPEVMAAADDFERRFGEAGLLELAKQGVTLGLADEASGVGQAIGGALTGDLDLAKNYQLGRDVQRELIRRAQERTGGFGVAAELAGGGGAIRTVGNMALNAGRAVASRGAPVTRSAIQSQMARQAGIEGAGVGAVAGFGYGEGTEESLTGAGVGAAGGFALGRGGQSFLNRRANRGGGSGGPAGGNPQGPDSIAAADRLNAQTGSNIALLPADVAGPGIRNVTGGAAKMTISGGLIGRASQRLTDQAEKAKNAIVSLAGGRAEPEIAGEQALEGARKWMKTSATKRDALYAKARKAGGSEPVDLANARQVLDGHIAELSQTPGSAVGVDRLRALRAELDQPFPVEGVKRMRSRLRDDFGGDGLRSTDIERRVGQVIDAAEDDIVTSLQAAGKGNAATAYRQAATAHRERVQVIDEVLAPIIGKKGSDPKSGEQIITAIEQAAKGNSAKLGRFLNTLPKEDAALVRGTIIDRLGRATSGQQDDVGGQFSLNTFLTRWNDMSDRAKGTMFSGEVRSALNDLAKVASARRDSGRFVNFSNTGSTVGNIASGGALAGSVSNPATLGLFAIDGLTGALLSSPRFARWLAKMPTQTVMQRKHIMGLEKIAAADGAIAADALGLQQQLLASFGPSRLAADQGMPDEGSNTTGSGTR